jgi:hypothetical protein
MGFSDLHAKFVSYFNTNIPAKRSSIKLFGTIQSGGESTMAYLKKFSKEMLNVKEFIEPVASKA